jgi:hypothetical protein
MLDSRIHRLRELIARLEQAPPSDKRDALLMAARDRLVVLEVGDDLHKRRWRVGEADRSPSFASRY